MCMDKVGFSAPRPADLPAVLFMSQIECRIGLRFEAWGLGFGVWGNDWGQSFYNGLCQSADQFYEWHE